MRRVRRLLYALAFVAFAFSALILFGGLAVAVNTHAPTILGAVILKAFSFLFAGAVALVLCSIDRKLEALSDAQG